MRARVRRAVWMFGALALVAMPASAQESTEVAPLTPEDSALLANALVFDPGALATEPKKPLRFPGYRNNEYDITRTQKVDGSTTVVVKQPLQTEWSNSVGADLAPSTPTAYPLPLPTERNNGMPAGAAWASVGVPNLASVDARVDPTNEQGKVGTTIKHSIPFGSRFAMTVQGTYSVTEMLGQPSSGPGDLPLMTLPRTRRARCAAGLWQREGGQVQCPADRDHPGRRLCHRQQRSGDAQHLQRRSEALWPAACDHRSHRRRADHQQ